jgi:hypothetical protein
MNATPLFLFVGLPVAIGILGVIAAETFRARNMSPSAAAPKGSDLKKEIEVERILANIQTLIAEDSLRSAEETLKKAQSATNEILRGEFTVISSRRADVEAAFSRVSRDVDVGTLRKTYGDEFGRGLEASVRLVDVLRSLDKNSLSQLVHDYEAGTLRNVLASVMGLSVQNK